MEEIWKDIKGYEGLYKISNIAGIIAVSKLDSHGRKRRERILKPRRNNTRSKNKYYLMVTLTKEATVKNKRLHRLVAETFIQNPNNLPHVNHLDGNTLNNRVDNLEWCTPYQNMKHAQLLGLAPVAVKQSNIKNIYWYAPYNKWFIYKTHKHYGYYDSVETAQKRLSEILNNSLSND